MSKIVELESLIAHQDQQIQELNEIVTRQWGEIDTIKRYMQATKAKMTELENNIGEAGQETISVADEAAANKPPHY